MSDSIEIQPVGPVKASIRPPGSKSITNRALVCAALAKGRSTLRGLLDSEDTRVMIKALRSLGIKVEADFEHATAKIEGCGGKIPAERADLDLRNSGTSMRFLAALVSLGHGRYRLDGNRRMRERPIQDLLDALNRLGVSANSEVGNGCPPLAIHTEGLQGGVAVVRGDVSSQFLSGLLMAAPYARTDIRIRVHGPLVSRPYVRMTLAVMRRFGVRVETSDDLLDFFYVPGGQCYAGREEDIEPDASAASYFWAAAAITGGDVTVEGLSKASLQGDVRFAGLLEKMGCEVRFGETSIRVIGRPLRGIDVDMNAISDTAQTLGAVALFAEGPTTLRGIAHVRHKETDRIAALATEIRKLGAEAIERDDGLRIIPRTLHGAEIETYDDHRMAMSMALVGLKIPGVVIRDPRCTAKTYPAFFDDLKRLVAGK